MQQSIQAKVSERMPTKAGILFTGALDGRVIEILYNSRGAGATHVNIINMDGFILDAQPKTLAVIALEMFRTGKGGD